MTLDFPVFREILRVCFLFNVQTHTFIAPIICCVEIACSPCACMGFRRFPPTVQTPA